jgi:hypothetical protein
VLTGSLSWRRPDHDPNAIPVRLGNIIRLEMEWRDDLFQLWEMRVDEEPSVDLMAGEVSAVLADDLIALSRNIRDWNMRKKKGKKGGKLTAVEVTKKVCRREGVKIGRLSKATKNLGDIDEKNKSGLDVIKQAWEEEGKRTGREYVIKFRDGKLDVLPFERSKVLYIIRGILTSATLEASRKNTRPTTVIEATGRDGKRKITQTVFREAIVRRFGRSTEEKDYGRVSGPGELREKAMRDLAKAMKVTRTAELTIPGVPFMERGTTIRWDSDEPGWHGDSKDSRDRRYCFVTSASHTVSGASYYTSLSVDQKDPYLADERRESKDKRDEKNKKRG